MKIENAHPCPFCGSTNLRLSDWLLANDNGEIEVEIVECLNCDAAAPVEWWNKRAAQGKAA